MLSESITRAPISIALETVSVAGVPASARSRTTFAARSSATVSPSMTIRSPIARTDGESPSSGSWLGASNLSLREASIGLFKVVAPPDAFLT